MMKRIRKMALVGVLGIVMSSREIGKLIVSTLETVSSMRGNYGYRWLMICCKFSKYWAA